MLSLWLTEVFPLVASSNTHVRMDADTQTYHLTAPPPPLMPTSTYTLLSVFLCLALTMGYLVFVGMAILYGRVRPTSGLCLQLLLLTIFSPILSTVLPSMLLSVTFLGIVTYYMYQNLPPAYLGVQGKAVLITGCDQGIGHELAKKLDSMGLHVFAGCLFKDGPGETLLKETCSDRLKTLQLDVRDMVQVEKAAIFVDENLGDNELWGIVNNAGICYIGNVEMMTMEDMQKIMAVNYFGPVNVCKAFLPLLRRSRGRLVNIASNAGLAPIPLMGVYCASKAALASMTEVWRYELQAWGINVSMIIPSGYKTGILGYDKDKTAERWWNAASDAVRNDYGKDCFHIKFRNADNILSSDLSPIIQSIVDALLSTKPKTFYYKGLMSRSLPFLYLHLPVCISDPIMKVIGNWYEFSPKALKK
ncbi:estradiol 17-beta-dehydrogenase 2-like [Haliotis cracherodii]|uniref:estradiol 17-beta-dehydrogenase 2-like n=1 Tax=Haliotis cracherodii TaxID=6455 RepID=UPI0039E9599A